MKLIPTKEFIADFNKVVGWYECPKDDIMFLKKWAMDNHSEAVTWFRYMRRWIDEQ